MQSNGRAGLCSGGGAVMESSPGARGSAEPAIKRAFTELDRLLRGEVTQTASLRRGAIDVDPVRLSLVAIVLSMVYGACMGTFALFSARSGRAKGGQRGIVSPGTELWVIWPLDWVDCTSPFNTDSRPLL